MRQSSQDIELIILDDASPCGISLGHGYCAEHEMGREGINDALGINPALGSGLLKYHAKAIDPADQRLSLYERKKGTKTIPAETRLTFHQDPRRAQDLAQPKSTLWDLPSVWVRDGVADSKLSVSWDSRGFCIRAFGAEEREMVRKLHAAALDGDLLVSQSSSANPFSRSGLCLTILSMIPQKVHDEVAEKEAAQKRLDDAAAATGIKETLTSAGRRWYALAAGWSDSFKTIIRSGPGDERGPIERPETKHPVMFFLNPMEQKNNHSGWFTVEELEAWGRNEGPILKKVS